MPGFGFVRSELEIKTLTLHALNFIGRSVSFDELMQMVFVDDAINYFNFADYLDAMVKTEHVSVCSDTGHDRYSITKKGVRDLTAIRSSVPESVLRKCEKAAKIVREEIIRKNLVNVEVRENDGEYSAVCSLSDNNGEVFSFSMSAPNRESAKQLTANFYAHAERIYNEFLKSMFSTRD